ncbi:hypothetical protein QQS21_011092 [Conoideocrella luteorostrata]|uniref:Uncharacterized protein n=1 Tax=Conoideocrella luteorostrata TaxID=1105319 RepID=A0AAJ0CET4_9HYPO|nr:hypothetical protein QQS21_011092 [Conoideocrella luteorostrata]
MDFLSPFDSASLPSDKRSSSGSTSISKSTKASTAGINEAEEDKTIVFTTIQSLFNEINHTIGDSLTVTNVSCLDFAAIEAKRDKLNRKFRFWYQMKYHLLIVTIPTGVHEELHEGLYCCLRISLHTMGIPRRAWHNFGSTTCNGYPNTGTGGDKGEGDSSGGPAPLRSPYNAWPTIVFESGHTRSLAELRVKKDWWFRASNHDVKIVVLIKFYSQGILLIERWEETRQIIQPRQGATTTRAAAAQDASAISPILQQEIRITRDTTTDPPSYNVVRSDLVLSFRLLFLRDPGPNEQDIIIDVESLVDCAHMAWARERP